MRLLRMMVPAKEGMRWHLIEAAGAARNGKPVSVAWVPADRRCGICEGDYDLHDHDNTTEIGLEPLDTECFFM